MKATKWHKGIVDWVDGDTAHISVVFSWHVDDAYERAIWHKSQGLKVRVGGPAVHVMGKRLQGVAEVGGDMPDTVVRHNPMATYASRGCPVGCWFCIVPSLEGREFTLIDDFPVRPILCDNNLSALPVEFQEHIVRRYEKSGVPLLDANSGFEPKMFDEDTFARWKRANKGAWRMAYDGTGERDDVKRAMGILKDVPASRVRVYVLIGNEPVEACLDRIHEVLAWGGEPHVQPIMKLNARHKEPWVRHDWSNVLLLNMARWANRRVWRKHSFSQYRANVKTQDVDVDTLTMF